MTDVKLIQNTYLTMTEVLFIHGILGKPDYFDFLRECLPADGFRGTDVLLEGHCDTPQAFGRASMSRWKDQVAAEVERMRAAGSRVVIAAHSMGTRFAIGHAARGQADALFLLNPPLSLRLSPRMAVTTLKVAFGKIDDPHTAAAKAAYSISDDRNPLHYLRWAPRYLELFAEIRRTRPLARRLAVPARVYLSARDELVSPRSARWFPAGQDIALTVLPRSGHYCYPDADRNRIIADFSSFLTGIAAEQ